jgi:membrane-associated phospholipid phosphatase
MILRFFLFFIFFVPPAFSESESRLGLLHIFTKVPQTSIYTFKTSFSKESIPGWVAVIGSTAVLYYYDEKLYRGSEQVGRDLGIGNYDNTKSVVTVNGQELLRLPSDTGSFLYFLGDGWMHMAIAGSIMGYGYAKDRSYEVNTGIILVHGMLVSTIFNQTLKRSFGRESPEVKTQERGAWKPFPSFNEYNTKTASYDAMPSGHVMTATLTFTVLAERYPDQKIPIYSVGGVWISALMFEMMNNGVHWPSDYPLGIAMGWVIGKASTKIVAKENDKNEKTEASWNFLPLSKDGGMGMMAFKQF